MIEATRWSWSSSHSLSSGSMPRELSDVTDRFVCMGKSSLVGELGDGLGVCELSSVLISMLSVDHLRSSPLVVDCSGVDHWYSPSVCWRPVVDLKLSVAIESVVVFSLAVTSTVRNWVTCPVYPEWSWFLADCVSVAVWGVRVVFRRLEVGNGDTVGIRHTAKS